VHAVWRCGKNSVLIPVIAQKTLLTKQDDADVALDDIKFRSPDAQTRREIFGVPRRNST